MEVVSGTTAAAATELLSAPLLFLVACDPPVDLQSNMSDSKCRIQWKKPPAYDFIFLGDWQWELAFKALQAPWEVRDGWRGKRGAPASPSLVTRPEVLPSHPTQLAPYILSPALPLGSCWPCCGLHSASPFSHYSGCRSPSWTPGWWRWGVRGLSGSGGCCNPRHLAPRRPLFACTPNFHSRHRTRLLSAKTPGWT